MYKAENERLWQEVDILLRVIEEHTYNTKEITDYIKSHKDIKYDDLVG
jgi:transposase